MSAPPTLRRHRSFRDLVVYGLLFIGPLAPVGVFGVLDARTGGALVYVMTTRAMGFTAWSYPPCHVSYRGPVRCSRTLATIVAGTWLLAGFLVMRGSWTHDDAR